MKTQFYFLGGCANLAHPLANSPILIHIKTISHLKNPAHPFNRPSKTITIPRKSIICPTKNPVKTKHMENPTVLELTPINQKNSLVSPNGNPSFVMLSVVSIGFMLFLMAMDDQKALALGPEGPLMEEFWENLRRYAIYALTVSTGALYTIFLPIFELLKNPISAVLVLIIFGGSMYIIFQVLSAMVGVSDFTYDYAY